MMNRLLAQIPLDPISGVSTGYQALGSANAGTTFEKILSVSIGFLTVVAGLAFVVYTVLAGLTWITAREESERISKAKQMLTNALIGLALVVVSWAFTGIMSTIFGFDILNPATVLFSGGTSGGGTGGTGGTTDCGGGLNIGQCGAISTGGQVYCCVAAGTQCNGTTLTYSFNCRQDWIGH